MYDSKCTWEFLKQGLLSNKVISEFNENKQKILSPISVAAFG